MEEFDNEPQQLRDTRGCLVKGHARIPGSGRPPGKKNWSVRALAEQLGVNPFLVSLEILKTQHLPAIPGEPGKKGRLVTTAEYIKVLTEIQPYLAAKLQATQLTGNEGGPLAVATVDITELLRDPALVEAGQLLAIGMAEQQQRQIAGPLPDSYDDLPANGGGR